MLDQRQGDNIVQSDIMTHGGAVVQNLFERTAQGGANTPVMNFAVWCAPVSNVIFFHNTILGERVNMAYNDQGDKPVLRQPWFERNNIFHNRSEKSDLFNPYNGSRMSIEGNKMSVSNIKVGIAKGSLVNCGELGDWTVHDPLEGGVLWVGDGTNSAALITLDLVELTGAATATIKKAIARRTSLAPDRVMIACSHTHSGMEFNNEKLGTVLGELVDQARQRAEPASVAFGGYDVGRQFSANRRVRINEQFGDATVTYSRGTKVSVQDGTIDARGQIEDLIRYGSPLFSPQYADQGVPQTSKVSAQAAAILQQLPATMILDGPVDPYLEVLAFRRPDGSAIGSLVRFSCHAVIFRGSRTKQFSADFPGVLQREISKATGAPTLFVNGPSGNTKPVFTDYGAAEMERFGTALAQHITKGLPALSFAPLQQFYYDRQEMDFDVADDMRGVTSPDVMKAERRFEALVGGDFNPLAVKRELDHLMRVWAGNYFQLKEKTVRLPVSLMGFNQTAVVTLSGEIFAEHGLALKKRFPGTNLIIAELTDGIDAGYVPTQDAFRHGGYEVSCSTLAVGSGEKMVNVAESMIKRMFNN